MLKRIIAVITLAALPMSLGIPGAGAGKPTGTDTRNACHDFIDGQGTYNGVDVNFQATLLAPSCADSTYTLFVYDGDGGASGPQTVLASETQAGDGESVTLVFSLSPNDNMPIDQAVCVYAKSFDRKGREQDRAPDAGCELLSADPLAPPPGRGFH